MQVLQIWEENGDLLHELSTQGLSEDMKTKYWVSYDYEKTSNFGKQEFAVKAERIVAPEVAVWVKWVHTKVDGRKVIML